MITRTVVSALLVGVVLVSSYAWYLAYAVCAVPITYRVGTLDTSFNLTEAEAKAALTEAESLWEDATGLNLFTYEAEGQLPVNFVFDERQQLTDIESELSNLLNALRDKSEAKQATYEALETSYLKEKERYGMLVSQYESALRSYNEEVARWNDKGGAPSDVYEMLNTEQARLAVLNDDIEATREALNERIDDVNTAASEATIAVEEYNQRVNSYNEAFSESAEFTQGDYQGTNINIYQFSSKEELVLVLAHELGHALGVDHVNNEASLMYAEMGAQKLSLGASTEDVAGFTAVCGDGSVLSRLRFW